MKYYAITATMTFEKTVLVPIDKVADIEEAKELIEKGVEDVSIDVLGSNEGECYVGPSLFTDKNGIVEKTDDEAACYQIIGGDANES